MSTAATSPPSAGIPPDRLANLIMASRSVVAAAELLPFPYLKGALGPVIPLLEAVQKMAKNREDFTELCASIVEIITLLQEEISRHGADAASRFTDVFFLDASTADTIRAGLKNIALTHSLGSDHEDASRWMASGNKEWLLVFDNADDPKINLFNFFPRSSRGNILITSRNPQHCVHAPGAHHKVSDLEEETAVQLLLVSAAEPFTSETERLATEIVKVLHCFPLAVVQAGAYILKTRSLRRYLSLYEQSQARLLSEVSVQSHDRYACQIPAAVFLSPSQGISEEIFSNAALYTPKLLNPTEEQIKEPRAFLGNFLTAAGTWDTLSFAEMTAEIQEYSLINQDPHTSLFSIHPLVHSWSRHTVFETDATRECIAALVAMSVSWKDPVSTMRLLPHLSSIIQKDSQLATEYLYPYCRVYYDSRNFQKAQELCEDLLEKIRFIFGAEHPRTMDVMAILADIYSHSRRFTDAEALDVVVLEMRRQTLGPDHPSTLSTMVNLGATYQGLGRLTEAEELGVVALERSRQTLGLDHPNTLIAMGNLATTYVSLDKLTDAEELRVVVLEKSKETLGPGHPETLLAMAHLARTYWRETLGPEHPDTLLAMGNLASTYRGLGKLTDAEQLEVVVLEKRRQTLGPEHPDTLLAMGNLANTYLRLRKLTDAEELLAAVLSKRRQSLGPEHPDTLLAMANLAITYQGLRKLTDAEELEVVVLEKRRQTLGPEHPDTLIAMTNLADTYWALGKLTQAEELEVVVLESGGRLWGKLTEAEELGVIVVEKRRQTLGSEHPDTLLAMGNLSSTYWKQGKLTEAEELQVVLLEKSRQTLGPEHPNTLIAMGNLASTYCGLGKLTDAEELEVVVLEKKMQTLSLEHPDTLTAMGNLAYTYYKLGKLTDAEELGVIVLEKRNQILGSEHPDTRAAMANLAATYRGLGKLTEAEELETIYFKPTSTHGFLWDMGHHAALNLTDFYNLFAGTPNWRLPTLGSLTEVYESFGSYTPFKHVLRRMKWNTALSLHIHTMLGSDLPEFDECTAMLGTIVSFTYSGWACDPLYMHNLFASLPPITQLMLLTTNTNILHSLLFADAIIGNNSRWIVQACPRLMSVCGVGGKIDDRS
ncbi:hypothetical protein C8J57DRAFT_1722220 [Mycena rebaudengoi]|nr:hypothetical protein C8J57DRAFT_1722220 [Mycena rebaudengoi]